MLFTKNLNPIIGTTLLVLAFSSCSNFSAPQIEFQSAPEHLISAKELSKWISSSDDQYIQNVLSDPAAFELQIQYSRRSSADQTEFEDYQYSYALNQKKPYFYPASTVKLPTSIFALEKLNEFENINRDTPFLVQGDTLPISTARCVEQIFAVSDNKANNLLFEFLGTDYYNRRFKELGF